MSKTLKLMVPGPTPLPPEVREALSGEMIYHRDTQFCNAVLDVIEKLKYLLYLESDTDHEVLLIPGTGRAAMEASLVNCFSRGDKVLGVSNGHFGELFVKMAEALGLSSVPMSFRWDGEIDLVAVEEQLKADSSIKGILLTCIETSNAVQNDVAAIGALAKKYNKLLLVDAVSALGCTPIRMKEDGIDVLISASQKGLMCPAGMSVVVLSPGALAAVAKSDIPKYYFAFEKMLSFIGKGQTHVSTPVPIVLGLQASLRLIAKEGREQTFARHEKLSNYIRSEAEQLGYSLYPHAFPGKRASSLSAFDVPAGLTSGTLIEFIKENYDTIFSRGLGANKDSIFRIGHMGYCSEKDAEFAVAVLRSAKEQLFQANR